MRPRDHLARPLELRPADPAVPRRGWSGRRDGRRLRRGLGVPAAGRVDRRLRSDDRDQRCRRRIRRDRVLPVACPATDLDRHLSVLCGSGRHVVRAHRAERLRDHDRRVRGRGDPDPGARLPLTPRYGSRADARDGPGEHLDRVPRVPGRHGARDGRRGALLGDRAARTARRSRPRTVRPHHALAHIRDRGVTHRRDRGSRRPAPRRDPREGQHADRRRGQHLRGEGHVVRPLPTDERASPVGCRFLVVPGGAWVAQGAGAPQCGRTGNRSGS